jgi:hypothetical protein
MTLPLRDRQDADAILTDLYLDSLLAAHDRHASDVPATSELDPAVRFAAGRLSTDLARVHPSFRFEERLAARLAEVAARMRLARAAGDDALDSSPVDLRLNPPFGPEFDPTVDPALDPAAEPDGARLGRPLLIGGALTSAALSLAGAAYVAWRRTHPETSPMARAVRVVGQRRLGRDAVRLAGALPRPVPSIRGRGQN